MAISPDTFNRFLVSIDNRYDCNRPVRQGDRVACCTHGAWRSINGHESIIKPMELGTILRVKESERRIAILWDKLKAYGDDSSYAGRLICENLQHNLAWVHPWDGDELVSLMSDLNEKDLDDAKYKQDLIYTLNIRSGYKGVQRLLGKSAKLPNPDNLAHGDKEAKSDRRKIYASTANDGNIYISWKTA